MVKVALLIYLSFFVTFKAYSQPTPALYNYLHENYTSFIEAYNKECLKNFCDKHGFNNLPVWKSKSPDHEVSSYWKKLSSLTAEEKAKAWYSELDSSLAKILDKYSGSFSELTLKWWLTERAVAQLKLTPKDPAYYAINAELQARAFQAFQFMETWELGFDPGKVPLDNIHKIRMQLLRARLFKMMGKYNWAERHILKILETGIFSQPEIITSKVYQDERKWAWRLLYSVAQAKNIPATAHAIKRMMAGFFKNEDLTLDPREQFYREWLEKSPKFKNQIFFADLMTWDVWSIVLSAEAHEPLLMTIYTALREETLANVMKFSVSLQEYYHFQ